MINFFRIKNIALMLVAAVAFDCSAEVVTFGSCKIDMPLSPSVYKIRVDRERFVVGYKVGVGGKAVNARIELVCLDKSFDDVLASDFEKTQDGWLFATGAQGSIKTTKVSGKGWSGLASDYYLGANCFSLLGKIGESHSFSMKQCGASKDLMSMKSVVLSFLKKREIREVKGN